MPVVIVGNQAFVTPADSTGTELAISAGTAVGSTRALIIAGSDGTNARFLKTATDGTLRIDPTGTTTQPISAASLPLPTGAATETTLVSRLADTTFTGRINTFGQKTMANSTPVVLASDQTVIPINDNGGSITVDGTVTANQGSAAALASAWPIKLTDGTNSMPTMDTVARAGFHKVTDGTNTAAVKAASTAAIASDPALVVAISPNNTPVLPSGAATSANQTNGTQKSQRVDGSGNIAPAGDVAARSSFVEITDGTNVLGTTTHPLRIDPTGTTTQPTSLVAPPTDRTASGNITALNGTIYVSCQGAGNIGVQITGTWSATLQFEGTLDGTNWFAVDAFSFAGSAGGINSTTANGQWWVASSGMSQFRIRASAFTSQISMAITLEATAASARVRTTQSATSQQVQVTDGTHGPAAVKAASTAPVATDPAFVVVVSPNQQAIPVTNTPADSTNGIAYGEITTGSRNSVPVEKTTYTEQTSSAQRSIKSSSGNDTSAGTGARQVKITYFDSTGTGPYTETVTMNGTSAVNTSNTNICFIESMNVVSAGSTGSNVGTITLYTTTGGSGTTIGTIATNDNQTLWAHHYVASGKKGYVTGMTGNNNHGSDDSLFEIYAQALPVGTNPSLLISDSLIGGGGTAQSQRTYGAPLTIIGPARITLFVSPNGTPTIINRGSFDFYEL